MKMMCILNQVPGVIFLLLTNHISKHFVDANGVEEEDFVPEVSRQLLKVLNEIIFHGHSLPFTLDDRVVRVTESSSKRANRNSMDEVPPGFIGVRGRKSGRDKKQTETIPGFLGVRGKKHTQTIPRFLGVRGKKQTEVIPGFLGVRGKKQIEVFPGFLGVRGKKMNLSVASLQQLLNPGKHLESNKIKDLTENEYILFDYP